MVETVIVSALVSFIVARLTAHECLKMIDKYADGLIDTAKAFFSDLLSILNKRI